MRSLRLLVAVVALAAFACTSDESPTATGTTSGTSEATATGAAMSLASATVLGADPIDVAGGAATLTPRFPRFGSWIVDVRTGGAAELGDDANSLLSLRDSFSPSFVPDGSAVWLSRSRWTNARRYALDGTVSETIEGAWGVVESPDGQAHAYYLRGEGVLTSELVAERDGVSYRLDGRHALPAFAPDGRTLAYYAIGDRNVATLDLLDLGTGVVRTLATDVDPCPCDLTPHPEWSPSGSYIVSSDFGGNDDASELGWATFLVDVGSGEQRMVVPTASPGGAGSWLGGASTGDRLVLWDFFAGTVSVLDLPSEQSEVLFEAAEGERLNDAVAVPPSHVQVVSFATADATAVTTRLFDAVTGDLVARWDRRGVVAVSPEGPAFVSVSARDGTSGADGCEGALVEHRGLGRTECLEGVETAIWSPDGTSLATGSSGDGGTRIGVWSPDGGHQELVTIPTNATLIGWNEQGTHLLVSDISGL